MNFNINIANNLYLFLLAKQYFSNACLEGINQVTLMNAKIILIIFFATCQCQEDENNSSENYNDLTCDANKEDCNASSTIDPKESAQDKWTPFRYESTSIWVNFNSLYSSYVKWHNKTLFNARIPCDQKKVLVFSPNAGLGDSIGALTSGFHQAIKTGR